MVLTGHARAAVSHGTSLSTCNISHKNNLQLGASGPERLTVAFVSVRFLSLFTCLCVVASHVVK